MKAKLFIPLLAASIAASPVGLAADIGVCVKQAVKGNPAYYGLMTTNTKLQCELQAVKQNRVWTAPELYDAGWRLIEVVGGDTTLATQGKGPSPMYIFERENRPEPEKKKRRGIFGGSFNSGQDEGSGLF